MLNLEAELQSLVDALDDAQLDYALCGALAMAVHGFVRATLDIDVLIEDENAARLAAVAHSLGFAALVKHDENDDRLLLDPLIVTAATLAVWQSRVRVPWGQRSLSVVSRDGLVALKRLRATGWDLVDVNRLFEEEVTGTIALRISRASQLHKLCLSLAKANPAKK